MITGRRWSVLVVIALAAIGLVVSPGIASGANLDSKHVHNGIRLTPIGNPTWRPVDLRLFSAPIGTAATGYAEFTEQQSLLLPPPNHIAVKDFGIAPGAPHKGPYTTEFRQAIRSLGYDEATRFTADEFSNGNGVWLVWMAVPRPGTTGSSPDFRRGPIIPNSLFPITVFGSTFRDGEPFSDDVTFKVPPLDGSVLPSITADGHSHIPVFFADNRDFGPDKLNTDPAGQYHWHMTMTDSSGSGWNVDTRFEVE